MNASDPDYHWKWNFKVAAPCLIRQPSRINMWLVQSGRVFDAKYDV
jgi:hypothetical protein